MRILEVGSSPIRRTAIQFVFSILGRALNIRHIRGWENLCAFNKKGESLPPNLHKFRIFSKLPAYWASVTVFQQLLFDFRQSKLDIGKLYQSKYSIHACAKIRMIQAKNSYTSGCILNSGDCFRCFVVNTCSNLCSSESALFFLKLINLSAYCRFQYLIGNKAPCFEHWAVSIWNRIKLDVKIYLLFANNLFEMQNRRLNSRAWTRDMLAEIKHIYSRIFNLR